MIDVVVHAEQGAAWPAVAAAVEAARVNAPRHSADYVRGFSVREPDGSMRVLTQLELLAVVEYERQQDVVRLDREGCCGCRGSRGDCQSIAVANRLRVERGNRGMGTRSLSRVGGLCPLSEWWIAYDVTRDAGAVAEARFSGELTE